MKKILFVLLVLLFTFTYAFAATIAESRGKSTFVYKGGFSGNPKTEEKQEAFRLAVENAWNMYIAKLDTSKKNNYEKHKKTINYTEFILETMVVDESINKSLKNYEVVVRVRIDEDKFNSKLGQFSEVMGRDKKENSNVVTLFVGRKAANTKSFDDRKVKVKKQGVNANAAIETEVDEMSEQTSMSAQKEEITEVGGSSTSKADVKEYEAYSITSFSGTFNKVLGESGYNIIDYDILLRFGAPDIEVIQQEYLKTQTIRGALLNQIEDAAREAEIAYIVIGNLDLTTPERGISSNARKVTAIVYSTVYNITGKFRKTAASISAEMYEGRASDDDVAATAAINSAAAPAAKLIVDQLHSSGAY